MAINSDTERGFLRKLFGGISMTWPRVIIFALAAGALTALILSVMLVLRSKKARLTAGAVSLAALILLGTLTFGTRVERLAGNVLLDEEAYPLGESRSVAVTDESVSTGEIRQNAFGTYQLIMHYYKTGKNTVILTDGDGRGHRLVISLDEDNRIASEEP